MGGECGVEAALIAVPREVGDTVEVSGDIEASGVRNPVSVRDPEAKGVGGNAEGKGEGETVADGEHASSRIAAAGITAAILQNKDRYLLPGVIVESLA